jgi:lia operon protein LiaG
MKNSNRTNRVILGVLFIVLAALGAARFLTGTRFSWLRSSEDQAGNIRLETQLSLDELSLLDLTTVSADIIIEQTPESEARAVLTGSARIKPDLFTDRAGSSGFISVDWPNRANTFARSMRLTLYLPRTYTGALSIHTVSGDITLPQNAGWSDLAMETSSGDCRGSGISVGELKFHTISGDLTLTETSATQADLRTISGDVSFTGSAAAVSGSSVSGNFQFSLQALSGPIDLKTTSGDIRLGFTEEISATLSFTTTSGNLQGSQPFTLSKQLDTEAVGTAGEGTWPITVTTVSGDLRFIPSGT